MSGGPLDHELTLVAGGRQSLEAAVFLDRDGILLERRLGSVDAQCATLVRGAAGALRTLKAHGWKLIVVSNQPGVALGLESTAALVDLERRIQELLAPSDVAIDAFYYCLHWPQSANVRYAVRCLCRKPQPGLLRRAALDWRVDLAQSWLIGAVLDDVEAGNRAGCRTLLLHNGEETEWRLGAYREPDDHARSLRQAAQLILRAAERQPQRDAAALEALELAARKQRRGLAAEASISNDGFAGGSAESPARESPPAH